MAAWDAPPPGLSGVGLTAGASPYLWLMTSELLFFRTNPHVEMYPSRTAACGRGAVHDRGMDGWSENIHFINDVCQLVHGPYLSHDFSGQTLGGEVVLFLSVLGPGPREDLLPAGLALFVLSRTRAVFPVPVLPGMLPGRCHWPQPLPRARNAWLAGEHGLDFQRVMPSSLNPQSPIRL